MWFELKILFFQELKTKLAEEISRMRYFITGQRSDMASLGNTEHTASEVEVLMVLSFMFVTKLDLIQCQLVWK